MRTARWTELSSMAIKRLNSITGFDRINHLKRQVADAESQYSQHRTELHQLRTEHAQLVTDRSQCSKDINGLLQRKHNWQPADVQRFTDLYAKEHGMEMQESSLRSRLAQMEAQVERSHDSLMTAISERYREELLWSDHVRSISGYGTLGLMVVNLLMFGAVHGWLEPRRRQRMQDSLLNAMQAAVLVANSSSTTKATGNDDDDNNNIIIISDKIIGGEGVIGDISDKRALSRDGELQVISDRIYDRLLIRLTEAGFSAKATIKSANISDAAAASNTATADAVAVDASHASLTSNQTQTDGSIVVDTLRRLDLPATTENAWIYAAIGASIGGLIGLFMHIS